MIEFIQGLSIGIFTMTFIVALAIWVTKDD